MGRYPKDWTCACCGAVYVVPSLARWCELKHREMESR